MSLRPDLQLIAEWISPGASVLDLGCGDGALLSHLQRAKNCHGYGVEIDGPAMLTAVKAGVSVIQQNIESGLDMFRQAHFDVVVLSMAIQATHETERVLREMSDIGVESIVSLPNFGHWSHAWSLLLGHMPVSRELPYEWYNTPNLHMATVADFENLLQKLGMQITGKAFFANGGRVRRMAGLRATQAIYRFRRAVPAM